MTRIQQQERRSSSASGSVFRLHDHPGAVTSAWHDLCQRVDAPPFAWPQWFDHWHRAFGKGRDLRLAAVHTDDRLTGVLPLLARGRTLQSPTNGHSPFFGPVTENADAARTLFAGLAATRPSALLLPDLVVGSIGLAGLRQALAPALPRQDLREARRSAYTDLTGDWEAFAAHTRISSRSLRRQQRRAAAYGPVRCDVVTSQADLATPLAECFDVEASGWKGREGTAMASVPAIREFYEATADWLAASGLLRLYVLRIDDRPAAFEFNVGHHGVLYSLKIGYDEAFAGTGPGRLLQHHVLQGAFADPALHRFEWLGDLDEVEGPMGTGSHVVHAVRAYSTGLGGHVRRGGDRLRQGTEDVARQALSAPVRARLRAARGRWSVSSPRVRREP